MSDTICSARALLVSSVALLTTTFMPFVPDCSTSCLALVRSGAVHLVVSPPAVYGQYGLYPGKFGGRIWQVGCASDVPPPILTYAARSAAKLIAWRAIRLLNGGRLVFSAKYHSAVSGLMCTWFAYLGSFSSFSRSDGITSPSNTSSAAPFSTCVTSSEIGSPYFSTIVSGYP